MAIDIDGYAVLGAISRTPEAFPAIKNEVSKVARTLVVKQLKEKALPAERLRQIAKAIEPESFDLILDLMTDSEIKSLTGKVDKLNGEAKAQSPQWQRKHVSDIALRRIEPSARKAPSKATTPKEKPPQAERAASARFSKAKKKV